MYDEAINNTYWSIFIKFWQEINFDLIQSIPLNGTKLIYGIDF